MMAKPNPRPPNKPSIPPRPAPRPKPVKTGWNSMADNQTGQLAVLPFTSLDRVEKHRPPGGGGCLDVVPLVIPAVLFYALPRLAWDSVRHAVGRRVH